MNRSDPERPPDGGRFVLSDDGRTVRLADRAMPPDPRDDSRPNWWLRALLVWFAGLAVVYLWWQVDSGQCTARVATTCASGPCGPDAGWGCGLAGAFMMMLWFAVLVVGGVAAGVARLVRVARPHREGDPPG